MTSTHTSQSIDYFPPRDMTREPLAAPIDEVTLLEDRAQIKRLARPTLPAGRHKLIIEDVSPILQDVSLRASVEDGRARIADIHVRRALKAKRAWQAEDVRAIDEELKQFTERDQALTEDGSRLAARAAKLQKIIALSTAEIPQDVAWGVDDAQSWHEDLEQVFTTHRELVDRLCTLEHEQREVQHAHGLALKRRELMLRPDQQFVSWLELDLIVESECAVTLHIHYVVPNAMWRPTHSARLDGDVLSFTSKAALWQNTGEDWKDVQLIFSTARSSLGTDAPMLSDDLIKAQRKQEETVVQMREVAIQSASVGGGGGQAAPAPSRIQLQGVDDGGDIQNIRAEHRVNISSDGQPHFINLFDFKALAEVERVLIAELAPRVVLRALQRNTSKLPILAGPVELLLRGGPVGWTDSLFVAPGERFELGFGPDESIRVVRHTHLVADEVDPQDKWHHRTTLVQLFLSNLSDDSRTIVVKERVPISEIEKVKVFILKNKTTDGYDVDEDGIITWERELDEHTKHLITMEWRLSSAPDVSTS